jgi:dihydrofolate reductase
MNAIAAITDSGGIGFKGGLPWPRNSEDLKYFRDKTMGKTVFMGKRTFESLGSKPLPGRINLVTPEKPTPDAWIIGGASVYRQWLPHCERVYLTRVSGEYECDTFFPMDLLMEYFELESIEQGREVYRRKDVIEHARR